MDTINSLVEQFKSRPDHEAIIHNRNIITYGEFYNDLNNLAFTLQFKYCIKKKPVLISCKSKYLQLLAIYSVICAQGIAVPIGEEIGPDSILSLIRNINSSLIITDRKFDNSIGNIKILRLPENILKSQSEMIITNENQISIHEPVMILFSSGSSGEKKRVLLSHNNLICTSKNINKFMKIDESIIEYVMIPLYHSFGFGRTRCVFMKGGTIVIDDGIFNALLTFKRLLSLECNAFSALPANIELLIKYVSKKWDKLKDNIKYVELGSAPMRSETKEFLVTKLPHARICMHYGLTEASRSCFIEFRSERNKLNSVGKASPGTEVKIINESGNEVPTGKKGEITVSGLNVALGYYNSESLTANQFKQLYFRTGDYGYMDKNGYIYNCGRNDDVVNVGGNNVSIYEIESLISNNALYSDDFCIIESEDKKSIYGKILLMCVTSFFKQEDFIEVLSGLRKMNLNSFMLPKDYIVLKQIPRTENGKIKRKFLTDNLNKFV